MRQTPHDEFFKFAFSFSQLVHDFFSQIPPVWLVDLLELSTLQPVEGSFLSSRLRKYFTDKLFSCRLKNGEKVTLSCLIEHKSTIPPLIYDQLQRYVTEKHEADRKNKQPRSPVIPIVLYHGRQRWIKKPPHAYFSGLPKKLRSFTNAPDYILVDISRFSKRKILELRQGYLVNTLLVMKYAFHPAHLDRNVRDIFVFGDFYETTEEGQLFIKGLLEYFFSLGNFDEVKTEEIIEKIQKPIQKKAMTIADYYIKKGKEEHQVEVATRLLRGYPTWSDITISEISGLGIKKIKTLRKQLDSQGSNPSNGEKATP